MRIEGNGFGDELSLFDFYGDRWQLTYDKCLVSVGELSLAGAGTTPVHPPPDYQIFDMAQDTDRTGFLVHAADVPIGSYDEIGYFIAPSPDPTRGHATAEDVARMRDGGYAIWLEGTAERDGVAKHFAWGFSTRTGHTRCETGAVVAATGTAAAAIFIQPDVLFAADLSYDWTSSDPVLTFDLVAAADTDDDGEITRAELEAMNIQGDPRYQLGDRTEITDLWSFLEQQATTIGRGAGRCAD